jgi:hypothetical protein
MTTRRGDHAGGDDHAGQQRLVRWPRPTGAAQIVMSLRTSLLPRARRTAFVAYASQLGAARAERGQYGVVTGEIGSLPCGLDQG